jgi:hypothetical protein
MGASGSFGGTNPGSSSPRAPRGRAVALAGGALLTLACSTSPTRSAEPAIARTRSPVVKALGPMNAPRASAACVELADGRVLVAGGELLGFAPVSSAELFDPTNGTWHTIAPLSEPRTVAVALRLASGDALVHGGSSVTGATEIWSAVTERWHLGAASRRREGHTLDRLLDGRVVAVGGLVEQVRSSAVEIYDPIGDRWADGPAMTLERAGHASIVLADGRVLVVGHPADPRGEILSADGARWTFTGPMSTAREMPALGRLPDGSVVVAGGLDGAMAPLSTTELWDPATNKWSLGRTMKHARPSDSIGRTFAIVPLPSGALLIGGGSGYDPTSLERLDPLATAWTAVGTLVGERNDGACIARYPGGALFAGGWNRSGTTLYSAEAYVGAELGAACASGDECASGTCASGKCTAPPALVSDAGADSAADAASSAPDAAPPSAISQPFQSCRKDAECASGHCAEGVCCDTACTETCRSCVLPGTIGTCTNEPIGVDLRSQCGPARSCIGTCGGDGACIGATSGSQCAPARCTSASTGVGPAFCARPGAACPAQEAIAFDCGPYVCEPAFGACRSSCSSTDDCSGGFLCDLGSKTCVAPTPAAAQGGCAMANRASPTGAALLLGLALAAGARRRRRAGACAARAPLSRADA